ncbi:hydrogenase [Sulfolobales archaeon SCGC AB-777_J03]|nr:hydrogenase [Sulfolobales archaeon SCGC AB-777_K20]PVU73671.1 hydrogenase [Sulfolobales archaeon SCGC AB-777_J03]
MVNAQLLELISASIIVSALYIQGQAYFKPTIYAQAIQSALISVLAFYLGFALNLIDYVILGVTIVVLRSFIITYFLFRGLKAKPGIRESTRGVASELVVNLAFFFLAVFILYYFVLGRIGLTTEAGAATLTIFSFILFFQGLFLIVTRRSTIAQIIGFIEEENSIVLFGILTIPIPFLIEVSIFLDVLGLVVITSLLTLQKLEHTRLEELMG